MYDREFLEKTYLDLCAQLCWAVDFQAVGKYPTDFLVKRIIDGFVQMQDKIKKNSQRTTTGDRLPNLFGK